MMKEKAMIYGMPRMSLNELSRTEQIRLYLNDHPQCLTEKLMLTVAGTYMNYGYIRHMIKQMYPHILQENIMNDNFEIIPEHFNEQQEEI